VDPDDEKESPKPNFIEQPHIKAISDWVKAGGVLVLMGNDFGNCEFDHFNNLAREFGILFNKDSVNHVDGNNFEMGKINIDENSPVFMNARKVYLKEISTLSLTSPARSVQQWKGNKVMAVAKFGKGTVFAVGDPWFYNEYTDGRKLPAEFENFRAAKDLTFWLLDRTNGK
jgi:unsaturated rhamnogalacturonyl hydrolase